MDEPIPRYLTHPSPVWRDRADFLIQARVEDDREQLWSEQLSTFRFRLCCIPFFAYGMALGDEVETDADYLVKRVVLPSGRFVFRVSLLDSEEAYVDVITARLRDAGALLEFSSPRFFAVDAETSSQAKDISAWLAEREASGILMYETGRL